MRPAAAARPEIEGGDRIVQIAGEKIETDLDVFRTLATKADQSVEFVLERTGEAATKGEDSPVERIVTTVAANPMRDFGFTVEWLPIAELQNNSPAVKAGLEVGDEIVAIDGEPRGDLLTLEERMIRVARDGGSVEIEVKRGDESKTVSVTPILPNVLPELGPNLPLAINSLGVAIPQSLTIQTVDPDSEAATNGLAVGDELVSVEYLLSDEQKSNERYEILARDPFVNFVDDDTSWAEINSLLQRMEPGSKLKLEIRRNSERKEIAIATTASSDFFLHVRGLPLEGLEAHYESTSWSDAFYYGTKQVWRDGTRVLKNVRQTNQRKDLTEKPGRSGHDRGRRNLGGISRHLAAVAVPNILECQLSGGQFSADPGT